MCAACAQESVLKPTDTGMQAIVSLTDGQSALANLCPEAGPFNTAELTRMCASSDLPTLSTLRKAVVLATSLVCACMKWRFCVGEPVITCVAARLPQARLEHLSTALAATLSTTGHDMASGARLRLSFIAHQVTGVCVHMCAT